MNAIWFESLWSAKDEWCLRFVIALIHSLWQGVAVVVLAVVGGWLLRRRSAASRYLLNTAALISLPVCAAVTLVLVETPKAWRAGDASRESTSIVTDGDFEERADSLPPPQRGAPIAETPSEAAFTSAPAPAESGVKDHATASERGAEPPWVARVAPLIVAAYLVGTLLCLLRLGAAVWGGHCLRSCSRPVYEPALLEIVAKQSRKLGLNFVPLVACCERVAVPTVVGVIRPVVLLPVSLIAGLAPDQAAAILTHELAHIRRCDLLMNLLQRLIESLLFFHPAVWLISRRMSAEREACCDDLVVSSGYERLCYVDALLRMAEACASGQQPAAAALAASGQSTSQFEYRIRRLMDVNHQPRLRLTPAGMFCVALLVCSVAVIPAVSRNLVNAQNEARAGRHGDEDDGSQAETPVPQPPRDPMLKNRPLVKQISLTHAPQWALVVSGPTRAAAPAAGALDWYTSTGPLVLDNQRVLVGSDILDIRTGEKLGRLPLTSDECWPTYLRLSADRKRLLVCGVPHEPGAVNLFPTLVVQVWDVAKGKQIGTTIGTSLIPPGYAGTRADISADGKVVAAGGRGNIGLWDVASGGQLKQSAWQARRVDALAFSPDGNWLVVSDTNDLTYWKWRTDDEPRTLHVGRKIDALEFTPDSRYLAEGPDSRGDIQIRDMHTLKIVRAVKGEPESPLSVAADALRFLPDGKTLIVGNWITVDERKLKIPHRIHFWDVESGGLQQQFAMPNHQVNAIDISPDGEHLVARLWGPSGSLIAVWALAQGDDAVGQGAAGTDESSGSRADNADD